MSADAVLTLINMARQLLTSTDEQPEDRAAIRDALDSVSSIVSRRTGHSFSDDELERAVRMLETAYVVQQGHAVAVVGREVPVEWYVGDRRKPGPFMVRYLQKLQEYDWPVRSVDELRDSTARVVELLDDPRREGPWNWRGLVVGDVQSGKTAHYAGVINRSVDAGYRVIIVLAGMHNLLRLQTQMRLELDFLGYDTKPDQQDTGRMKAIGVGLIPPALTAGSLTLASPTGDFNVAFARQANFAPLDQPCLFVVKKNATILRNLNGWIGKLPEEFRRAPLLLIDDEADQASIDTKDQPTLGDGSFDEDYDPTKINGEIRKLLRSFKRSAYVAYTATPFANILIHDERSAEKYGADLFPSTFIFALTPPDDYFGPVAVFGTNDDVVNAGLPLIRHLDQAEEGWIPDVHDRFLRPRFRDANELPPSLKTAVRSFLLSCAIRAARGRPSAHCSMLIHVSRFVDVHDQVHDQVERYLDDVRARISGGDAETLTELETLWREDFEPTRAEISGTVFDRGIVPVDWPAIRAALSNSSDKIQVIVANGRSKSAIDYDRYKDTGLSVIAIGGDKLSRGLTLEGLTVSYFLRISKQYDSLLQMGRWFGYRRGFADVCRLFTTPDMEDWFRHVATASQELRAELVHMRLMLQTPKDYGLRVESHSVMNVTAPNKQRHAVERPTGFAGEGKIQTVMYATRSQLEHNAGVTDTFLESLDPPEAGTQRPGGGGHAAGLVWRNVPGERVAAYLGALELPPENREIEAHRLAAYVEGQLRQTPAELTNWTVFVPSGDGREVEIAGQRLQSTIRRPLTKRQVAGRYIVRSILNPPDEALDLTDSEHAEALEATNRSRQEVGMAAADRPSGPEIRRIRGRQPQKGMLILYPLDPDTVEAVDTAGPVIGLVVSFPESRTGSRKFYIENTVLQKERR
ncbi:Z1 domain-containing protein [Mesorhizobium sp. AR02]|uniref:Z1 domain-containing protein n=1 Tax=Mesorhizobium sp. AR02 TaxID=2865837 RepID=UPI00215F7F39|nr:Z1 domain-containing protein [Mesorhizobium sp. AR02]UVK55377.1 Z1 domain-containing protein [Mesorhizobium sp. AR02]